LKPEIRIGNTRFNKENVVNIQKKVHTPEALAKVSFDLTKLDLTQAGNYRIVLYIGLSMNSQDSFYANAFVYKGKPFYIEFPIKAGENAPDIVKRVVKIADKYLLFMTQEQILNVFADPKDSNSVVFEAVNGYQIIKKAVLQKYDPEHDTVDCCNFEGDFVDVITGVPVAYTFKGEVKSLDKKVSEDGELVDLASDETPIYPGIEAFCDYNWIIHNLRLPTLANTYFWAVNKAEMPVPGAVYNQYIVRMCADRYGISGEVVGQKATSITTHVFYVLDNGDLTAFETALKSVIDGGEFLTRADDVLKEPYKVLDEGNSTTEGGTEGGTTPDAGQNP
jgi:hypothetical protein